MSAFETTENFDYVLLQNLCLKRKWFRFASEKEFETFLRENDGKKVTQDRLEDIADDIWHNSEMANIDQWQEIAEIMSVVLREGVDRRVNVIW
jgi:hypothetical protein